MPDPHTTPMPEGGPFAQMFEQRRTSDPTFQSLQASAADPYFVKPQVGDIVHFWPSEQEGFSPNGYQPLAAIVLSIRPTDNKCCTLMTWGGDGQWRPVSGAMHRSFFTGLNADFEGNSHPAMSHWEYRR